MLKDISKHFIIVGLGVLAIVLLFLHRQPTPAADVVVGENDNNAPSYSDVPTWAANVPTVYPPPLSYMMPSSGSQPTAAQSPAGCGACQ